MIMDTKWTHEDNKKTRNLVYQVFRVVNCDLDRIQTCNPQSRNLIFYSVELRGHYFIESANLQFFLLSQKLFYNC